MEKGPGWATCHRAQHRPGRNNCAVYPEKNHFAPPPLEWCFSRAHLGQLFKHFHLFQQGLGQKRSVLPLTPAQRMTAPRRVSFETLGRAAADWTMLKKRSLKDVWIALDVALRNVAGWQGIQKIDLHACVWTRRLMRLTGFVVSSFLVCVGVRDHKPLGL